MTSIKRILPLFFIVFFLCSASALALETNKASYFKGERITMTGKALKTLQIAGFQSGKNLVFSEKVALDPNGNFKLDRDIGFLDLKGSWSIIATDSNTSVTKQITVLPKRESEFFVVAFLSPAPSSFRRLEKFELSIKVDDSGKPVDGAWVNYWNVFGERQQLKSIGDGKYSDTVEIPADAALGSWQLNVTAFKPVSGEKRGGENSINIELLQAGIVFEIIEPRVNEFVVGKPISLKVRVHYEANDSLIDINQARIVFEEVAYDMNSLGGGFYSVIIDPLAKKREAKPAEITLFAKDNFDNTASKTVTFRPIGEFFWFLRNNALLYIVPALFVIYILFLSARELSIYFRILALRRRKDMLIGLKKRLQQDYFIDNVISRQDFDKQDMQYNAELSEIESKLKSLEQKKELL